MANFWWAGAEKLMFMFSDDAYFWFNRYLNCQNCSIWCEEYPEKLPELTVNPEKCLVWCELWVGGVIEKYFFKAGKGRNVTVNGGCYRAIISNIFLPKRRAGLGKNVVSTRPCHMPHSTRNIGPIEMWIRWTRFSRLGTVNWLPRSCDYLTPLDNFLWGYVKAHVYSDKLATIDVLEANFNEFIREIPDDILERVCRIYDIWGTATVGICIE